MRRERTTIPASFRTGWARILPALFLALVACGDDHAPTKPPQTVEELTSDGWVAFEKGEFARASELFASAIVRDSLHAPAYVGDGWSRLELAADTTALQGALDRLDDAVRLAPLDSGGRAGRAAALLALGVNAAAVAEARTVIQMEHSIVFSHALTFDSKDLFLIVGSGLVAQGEFVDALNAANMVEYSVISPSDRETWLVDGIRYRTFADAVIAYMAKMSVKYAG